MPDITSRNHFSVIAIVLASSVVLQACAEHKTFVETLGNDTTAVESFTRAGNRLEGDIIVRSPVTRLAHYTAELGSDQTIRKMEVDWRTPAENPDGPPPVHVSVQVQGDSATVIRRNPEGEDTATVAAPAGVIPRPGRTPMSFGILDQTLRQVKAAERDSVPVTFLPLGRRIRPAPNVLARIDDSTLSYSFFGSPMLVRLGAGGSLRGISGARTTMKIEAGLVKSADIQALAADFAARDARGEGLGIASPGATVDETVAGAHFVITYSRPAKRGREIFGGLVPWNEVWRTGANAATMFSTDRDLKIGDVVVKKGEYTLWSVYTPEGGKLIINEQTGQWGTQYDESRDLARIDMQLDTLPESSERFTIAVEPDGDNAVLSLTWDTSRYSVPVTIMR